MASLTTAERRVLTFAMHRDVGSDAAMAQALDLPEAAVTSILRKLLDAGLLYALDLEDGTAMYLHDLEKVTREMLDDDVHYLYGGIPRNLYPSERPR